MHVVLKELHSAPIGVETVLLWPHELAWSLQLSIAKTSTTIVFFGAVPQIAVLACESGFMWR
jgi:hypothetical protein